MGKLLGTSTAHSEASLELRELETGLCRLRLGWIMPLAIALTDVVATVLSLQHA
jgi:hypothetical protein